MAFKDFHEFLHYLTTVHPCYHSKYIYARYCCPKDLYHNIHEWDKFNEVIDKLTDSKLYIHCKAFFDPKTLFNDYILPIAIFLHYMHVDIDKMAEIELYIVNDELYEKHRIDTGGEYTSGLKENNIKCHIILVRQFNDKSLDNKYTTLKSLFHELMHLVDNLDFNGLNSDIDYYHRWHEIKAYAISEFFVHFYRGVLNQSHLNNINNTLWVVNRKLRTISTDIMIQMNRNYEWIETNNPTHRYNNGSIDNCKDIEMNIELLKSMREINTLQNFFEQIEERLT